MRQVKCVSTAWGSLCSRACQVNAQQVDDLRIVQTASDDSQHRQRLFPRIAKGGASSFTPVQATMITQRRPMIVKMQLLETKNAAAAEVHVVDASWFVL